MKIQYKKQKNSLKVCIWYGHIYSSTLLEEHSELLVLCWLPCSISV